MSIAECNQYILAGQVLKGVSHTWPDQEQRAKISFINAFRNRST